MHDLRLKSSKQRSNLKVWSFGEWKRIGWFGLNIISNLKLYSDILKLK